MGNRHLNAKQTDSFLASQDRRKLCRNRYNYIISCLPFMSTGKQLLCSAQTIYGVVYFFIAFTVSPMKLFYSDDFRTSE